MEHRLLIKHILCPYTYPQHPDEVNMSIFFPESSHVEYQIEVNGA